MRVIEVRMEWRRNLRDSYLRKPVTRLGIEPGSPWWEASRLITQPPRPQRHWYPVHYVEGTRSLVGVRKVKMDQRGFAVVGEKGEPRENSLAIDNAHQVYLQKVRFKKGEEAANRLYTCAQLMHPILQLHEKCFRIFVGTVALVYPFTVKSECDCRRAGTGLPTCDDEMRSRPRECGLQFPAAHEYLSARPLFTSAADCSGEIPNLGGPAPINHPRAPLAARGGDYCASAREAITTFASHLGEHRRRGAAHGLGESCRTMPLIGEFSRGSPPFPLSFRSGAAPYATRFTLVGPQELDRAVGGFNLGLLSGGWTEETTTRVLGCLPPVLIMAVGGEKLKEGPGGGGGRVCFACFLCVIWGMANSAATVVVQRDEQCGKRSLAASPYFIGCSRSTYRKLKPSIWVIFSQKWATVAEWLDCSPPTKAKWVKSPAGSLRIFACWNRAGRCRWLRVFSGISHFPPPPHSGAATYSPHFTLIGSQDLDGLHEAGGGSMSAGQSPGKTATSSMGTAHLPTAQPRARLKYSAPCAVPRPTNEGRANPLRQQGRKIMQGDMHRGKEGLESHGLHFGAMTTSLSVLRASLNYEEQGKNRQLRRESPCDREEAECLENMVLINRVGKTSRDGAGALFILNLMPAVTRDAFGRLSGGRSDAIGPLPPDLFHELESCIGSRREGIVCDNVVSCACNIRNSDQPFPGSNNRGIPMLSSRRSWLARCRTVSGSSRVLVLRCDTEWSVSRAVACVFRARAASTLPRRGFCSLRIQTDGREWDEDYIVCSFAWMMRGGVIRRSGRQLWCSPLTGRVSSRDREFSCAR
ncbi:hypothetical protein PR048_028157 [Dryococelus australis]|uniref:Uncharacterized protein n=1 Tax=Dryococelus australis TaxID=614101 RepID=A0ABQ9GIF6_9NEOP|nr:hypothetical protein PR048_028157 [Dryococelus australis]